MNKSNQNKPPTKASRLLDIFIPDAEWIYLSGDFEELYNRKLDENGKLNASLWYWMQVIISILPFFGYNVERSFAMLKNYFKTAYRNIKKNKLYSAINILGLAVGIACCLLAYNFVRYEHSFDQFHEDADRIYEVGQYYSIDRLSFAVAQKKIHKLGKDFPEIESYLQHHSRTVFVKIDDSIIEEDLYISTPNFFEFFSFPLLFGDPETVIEDINSIVLTVDAAMKYLGKIDAVGETITINSRGDIKSYSVKGIAENPPVNSTVQFKLVIRNIPDDISFGTYNPYLKLRSENDAKVLANKINDPEYGFYSEREIEFITKRGEIPKVVLPSFVNKHLVLGQYRELSNYDKTNYSLILAGLSLIVLLIACFNYMNLTSGILSFRMRELGVRKAIGAARRQLLHQIILESQVISFSAFFIGVALYYLALPLINSIMDSNLGMFIFSDWKLFLFLISLTSLTGLLSALYPAVVFSRFNPINIFKNSARIGKKNYVTRFVIVIQFALSIVLIISTSIMYSQREYCLGNDLGFNPKNVINIPLKNTSGTKAESFYSSLQILKSKILALPDIKSGTISSMRFDSHNIATWGFPISPEEIRFLCSISGDHDFITTYEIDIIEGENFSEETIERDKNSVIVNEYFLKEYAIEQPIGKILGNVTPEHFINSLKEKMIIGVINNTNVQKLTVDVQSIIISEPGQHGRYNLALRLREDYHGQILENVKAEITAMFPDMPFSYTFVDDDIRGQYAEEERWEKIISYTSILAILIACSGLFALALLTVVNRLKEIGIRKVLGSSRGSIVALLNREFVVLILIANVIAWPVANYVMKKWLENFVYRIDLGAEYFFLSGAAAILIALLTVSYHTLKAANANPVEHLRSE